MDKNNRLKIILYMARPVTLYTLQWGDLSLETVCQKAKEFGYDGVELGLPDMWMFDVRIRLIIKESRIC